jgi:hypothetical protein
MRRSWRVGRSVQSGKSSELGIDTGEQSGWLLLKRIENIVV